MPRTWFNLTHWVFFTHSFSLKLAAARWGWWSCTYRSSSIFAIMALSCSLHEYVHLPPPLGNRILNSLLISLNMACRITRIICVNRNDECLSRLKQVDFPTRDLRIIICCSFSLGITSQVSSISAISIFHSPWFIHSTIWTPLNCISFPGVFRWRLFDHCQPFPIW